MKDIVKKLGSGSGGDAFLLNDGKAIIVGKREESHRMRKDFANTEIPYVILYDKMLALKEQIDVEEKLTKKYAILEYINKETLTELLSKDLEQSDRDKVIKTITKYIDKKISVEDDEKIVLGLSNQEKNEVLSQNWWFFYSQILVLE